MITTIFQKLVSKSDWQAPNLTYFAKKNLPVVLLRVLADTFAENAAIDTSPLNVARMDEALTNVYSLLNKLSKYGKLKRFFLTHTPRIQVGDHGTIAWYHEPNAGYYSLFL